MFSQNCADHTTGDHCQFCEPGYEGDATRGSRTDCSTNGTRHCNCNPDGTIRDMCHSGVCQCKANVEGPQCNRCRPSTFGLSSDNVNGCNECYCSGVTKQCHESSLYVQQIPVVVFDSSHGFTLTDS